MLYPLRIDYRDKSLSIASGYEARSQLECAGVNRLPRETPRIIQSTRWFEHVMCATRVNGVKGFRSIARVGVRGVVLENAICIIERSEDQIPARVVVAKRQGQRRHTPALRVRNNGNVQQQVSIGKIY